MIHRIEMVRENLCLTKAAFSKMLGIRPTHYSNILNGDRPVNTTHIHALMNKFNVNLNWLFSGNGQMFIVQDDDIIMIDRREFACPNEEERVRLAQYRYDEIPDKIKGKIETVLKYYVHLKKADQINPQFHKHMLDVTFKNFTKGVDPISYEWRMEEEFPKYWNSLKPSQREKLFWLLCIYMEMPLNYLGPGIIKPQTTSCDAIFNPNIPLSALKLETMAVIPFEMQAVRGDEITGAFHEALFAWLSHHGFKAVSVETDSPKEIKSVNADAIITGTLIEAAHIINNKTRSDNHIIFDFTIHSTLHDAVVCSIHYDRIVPGPSLEKVFGLCLSDALSEFVIRVKY